MPNTHDLGRELMDYAAQLVHRRTAVKRFCQRHHEEVDRGPDEHVADQRRESGASAAAEESPRVQLQGSRVGIHDYRSQTGGGERPANGEVGSQHRGGQPPGANNQRLAGERQARQTPRPRRCQPSSTSRAASASGPPRQTLPIPTSWPSAASTTVVVVSVNKRRMPAGPTSLVDIRYRRYRLSWLHRRCIAHSASTSAIVAGRRPTLRTRAIPLCPNMEPKSQTFGPSERVGGPWYLSLIHISEPTRLGMISYAVFCLKKKKKENN